MDVKVKRPVQTRWIALNLNTHNALVNIVFASTQVSE